MKSVESDEELESAKKAIKTLGGQGGADGRLPDPGTEVVHRVIFIKKIAEHQKNIPDHLQKSKRIRYNKDTGI